MSIDVDDVTLEKEEFPPDVEDNDEILLFQPDQPPAEHVEVTEVTVV